MIDIFTHVVPPQYYAELEKKSAADAIPGVKALTDLDVRFQQMEINAGIQQVITVSGPPLETLVKPAETIGLAQLANEEISKMVKEHPDKFVAGIAILPFADIESTLSEIDRAIIELGLRGIQIYTDINGKPLDLPEFLPIYEKMTQYGLPIFLHPINPPGECDYPGEQGSKFNLNGILGWPHATSKAMVRLSGSGIMEKFPTLKIVTHHCGGTVPYLAGRIGHSPFMSKTLTRPVTESLQLFYNDTAVQGNVANLMCGHAFCGSDHMVFGTDFPYANPDMVKTVVQSVNAMTIPDMGKKQIFSENARQLLKLPV